MSVCVSAYPICATNNELNLIREAIQKNKYQYGKCPNFLGPPPPLIKKKKLGHFLDFLNPSLLPKIRKSKHFFGEFQIPFKKQLKIE